MTQESDQKPQSIGERQNCGFYRMQLGSFQITVVSDGTASRRVDQIVTRPEELQKTLQSDACCPVDIPINVFLIDSGSNVVLVDAGAGELFGPHSGGQLIANLAAAGYQPEQIDTILLTHIHADHSGGLSLGGRRTFAKALVYVDKRDPEFWLNAEVEQAAPASRKETFRQSHATVDPYIEAGKLRPFDGSTEILPGIHAKSAYGHTPGHTAYMIESYGHRLLFWGDTTHLTDIQLRNPDVTVVYDVDEEAARATRKRLLVETSVQCYLVGGAHISFPGLGYVLAGVDGYSWSPLANGEQH